MPDYDDTARTNQAVDRVLINGFGFGGQNAALVMSGAA